MTENQEWVAIGRVLKPRGIQGEAFLHPLTDHVERFQDLEMAECESRSSSFPRNNSPCER